MAYEISPICREWRQQVALQVGINGFQVRHRSRELKYDEQGATFLYDMHMDPSSGLRVGEEVSVTGPLGPPVFADVIHVEDYEKSSYHSNRVYRILGFVEVECKIENRRFRFLHSVLLDEGFLGDEVPKLSTAENRKVHLFWVGSIHSLERFGQ